MSRHYDVQKKFNTLYIFKSPYKTLVRINTVIYRHDAKHFKNIIPLVIISQVEKKKVIKSPSISTDRSVFVFFKWLLKKQRRIQVFCRVTQVSLWILFCLISPFFRFIFLKLIIQSLLALLRCNVHRVVIQRIWTK